MLKFLIFLLAATSVHAGFHKTKGQVRNLDREDESYRITLQGHDKVFEFDDEHPVVPCLENAWKSGMRVELVFDEQERMVDCRLVSKPHPGNEASL